MSYGVEHLSPRDSLFARFDPRWKLASLLLATGALAAMNSPLVLVAGLAVSSSLAGIARVPGTWFRTRIGLLLVALLPFLLVLPATVDHGGPSYELLGSRLSLDGLLAAVAIACKTVSMVTLMLILLASSPFHVTLRAAQRLRVPVLPIHLAMLSYRFVFLLLDELNRLRIALRVRGFRNRPNRHSYRTIGQVTGTLLVRGAERAERVAQAMRCRGFDGTFRGLDDFQTTSRDVRLFVAIAATYAGLLAWECFS